MSRFKFEVGELVRFSTLWPGTPRGVFVVVGRHGEDAIDPAYRLRSVDDGALRMGIQSEMAAAGTTDNDP